MSYQRWYFCNKLLTPLVVTAITLLLLSKTKAKEKTVLGQKVQTFVLLSQWKFIHGMFGPTHGSYCQNNTVNTVSNINSKTLRIITERYGHSSCLSSKSLAMVCLGKISELIGQKGRNVWDKRSQMFRHFCRLCSKSLAMVCVGQMSEQFAPKTKLTVIIVPKKYHFVDVSIKNN